MAKKRRNRSSNNRQASSNPRVPGVTGRDIAEMADCLEESGVGEYAAMAIAAEMYGYEAHEGYEMLAECDD